ncbi:uncharacterized protein CC84DRAFT_1254107 [Paraphaeosphaeria sporulosa]|uniref:Rhodopsin domain-containing protein n=1 Tax=Paraphaeosphaeria sporulosa TaxID=1460663 RepID=A0A177CXC9_9PLEO|nr:uncharacterized protein CC84DRAFT_1254107 [Paraphaeosphaeria sporulosa]OAG11698.1 hypothetical protein CC84DRAFT_1254107 [Paraphaeosphaeria sporulosa]
MVAKGLFTPTFLGPTVETTAFSLASISTIVVLLRFYCRIWIVKKLKSYDYLIAGAVVCTWGLCVINHYQVLYGTGSGAWPADLPPPSAEFTLNGVLGAAKAWYGYQIVYLLVPALVKLSILVFYLTIATHRPFRTIVYWAIAFVTTYSIIMIIVNAFECPRKPSLVFEPEIFVMREQWHCFNLTALYFSQSALNIFSDLFILVLPLPILVKLHMPTIKRICLLIVFSVGLLVPIAASFRLWILYLWHDAPPDISRYYGGYILFWDAVELNTAIICASAPSLQPLFRRAFGELRAFSRGRSAYYYYGDDREGTVMTQTTIGRRGSRRLDQEIPLQRRPSSREVHKRRPEELESDLVVIREMENEEDIRIWAQASAVESTSTHSESHPPKSPARPRDLLASE